MGSALLVVFAQSTQPLAFRSIALFLPLLRSDLAINYVQAGVLAAASTFSYVLIQIPAGCVADRAGPAR